ncbi:Protein of unknown function [Flexibacter flexilis DSM 6793]|uniref:DUF2490 domain-containing protein n=1 Tax=Flexibacter flexilis DSM 6793 TaxID=927664 RepID=A0A1I1I6X4_9BACT|nr:DUF2490 domain-containing protein [Flexibacter flexilis]SFC29473.1 Protein of unknown function [Flexibacter flexilis DSM 6793]
MKKTILWLLLWAVVAASNALAQSTVKTYLPTQYWTYWQADYQFKDKAVLIFEQQTRSSVDSDYNFDKKFPTNQFLRLQTGLTYEKPINEHWSWGLGYRWAYMQSFNLQVYRGYATHRGKIGSVLFTKTLMADRRVPTNEKTVSSWRFRLWLGLSRQFRITAKHKLNVVASAEFFKYREDDYDKTQERRRIDRTRLRLMAQYPVSPKVLLSVFAMRQTDYLKALVTSNPPPVTPETYNLNRITPIYGLMLRWHINSTDSNIIQ